MTVQFCLGQLRVLSKLVMPHSHKMVNIGSNPIAPTFKNLYMEDIMDELVLTLSMVLLSIVMLIAGFAMGYSTGYKQGQIDYSNGIKKYCLTIQSDSSRIWVFCYDK